VHSVDLAGGFSDLEMTWLLYCAGAATGEDSASQQIKTDSCEWKVLSGETLRVLLIVCYVKQ